MVNTIFNPMQSRRRFLQLVGLTLASTTIPLHTANAGKPKIGIIGAGKVGGGIGGVWVKAGYEVMFSSRHIENDRALAAGLGSNAYAGTPREAAVFGDVVMISVPYHALPEVGEQLVDLIDDKVVIDTCNPFVGRDGEIAVWAREKGAGLASRELLPGARIVRAFNAIGAARMREAYKEPGRIGMPIASDDPRAAEIASQLIHDMGYEPVFIGDLEMGKYLIPGSPLSGERTPEEIRSLFGHARISSKHSTTEQSIEEEDRSLSRQGPDKSNAKVIAQQTRNHGELPIPLLEGEIATSYRVLSITTAFHDLPTLLTKRHNAAWR